MYLYDCILSVTRHRWRRCTTLCAPHSNDSRIKSIFTVFDELFSRPNAKLKLISFLINLIFWPELKSIFRWLLDIKLFHCSSTRLQLAYSKEKFSLCWRSLQEANLINYRAFGVQMRQRVKSLLARNSLRLLLMPHIGVGLSHESCNGWLLVYSTVFLHFNQSHFRRFKLVYKHLVELVSSETLGYFHEILN